MAFTRAEIVELFAECQANTTPLGLALSHVSTRVWRWKKDPNLWHPRRASEERRAERERRKQAKRAARERRRQARAAREEQERQERRAARERKRQERQKQKAAEAEARRAAWTQQKQLWQEQREQHEQKQQAARELREQQRRERYAQREHEEQETLEQRQAARRIREAALRVQEKAKEEACALRAHLAELAARRHRRPTSEGVQLALSLYAECTCHSPGRRAKRARCPLHRRPSPPAIASVGRSPELEARFARRRKLNEEQWSPLTDATRCAGVCTGGDNFGRRCRRPNVDGKPFCPNHRVDAIRHDDPQREAKLHALRVRTA